MVKGIGFPGGMAVVFVVLGLTFGLIGAPALSAGPIADEIFYGMRNWDYDTLDPHKSCCTEAMWIFMNVFDPLVWLGPDLKTSVSTMTPL